jgi:hypothetical protein
MNGAPKSRPSKPGRGTQMPPIPLRARHEWGTRCGGSENYELMRAAQESCMLKRTVQKQ